MSRLNKLQRRHYLRIAQDPRLTHRLLAVMHSGPEHSDYYDVAGWFDSALRIMTDEQRAELIVEYQQQLDHFEIHPNDLEL